MYRLLYHIYSDETGRRAWMSQPARVYSLTWMAIFYIKPNLTNNKFIKAKTNIKARMLRSCKPICCWPNSEWNSSNHRPFAFRRLKSFAVLRWYVLVIFATDFAWWLRTTETPTMNLDERSFKCLHISPLDVRPIIACSSLSNIVCKHSPCHLRICQMRPDQWMMQ